MRVIYFSGPAFFDLDLSFVKRLSRKVDCFYLLDLYPRLHKATALSIGTPKPVAGILPIDSFAELRVYSSYLDFGQTFVINRVSNNPLALSNLLLQWRLLRYVKKLQPDVVHFNNLIYFNHFYLFLCRGKKLISIHDPFPHSGDERYFASFSSRATRRINNTLVRNHLLFNSVMLERYRKASNLHATNIVTSRLGVYEHLNLFPEAESGSLSDILFFGRIAPYKGLDVLLSAFSDILKKMPSIVLVIAGSGSCGFEIAGRGVPAASLRLLNRYIPNAELAALIRGTKVVVCPYKDATQSGVIMTAFSFGKPVVATSVGGLIEMVEHGVTGVLVPPGDPHRLAEALLGLLGDEGKRMEMQKNIKRTYSEGEKSWERIVDRLVSAYDTLK